MRGDCVLYCLRFWTGRRGLVHSLGPDLLSVHYLRTFLSVGGKDAGVEDRRPKDWVLGVVQVPPLQEVRVGKTEVGLSVE